MALSAQQAIHQTLENLNNPCKLSPSLNDGQDDMPSLMQASRFADLHIKVCLEDYYYNFLAYYNGNKICLQCFDAVILTSAITIY